MLYNLEPDRTVTGGAWYSDQDFESEFVEVLNQQCYKFLEQKVGDCKMRYDCKCSTEKSNFLQHVLMQIHYHMRLIFTSFGA
jgi:hypothetical protein